MNYNDIKVGYSSTFGVNTRKNEPEYEYTYECWYYQPGEREAPNYRATVLHYGEEVARIEFRYLSRSRQWVVFDLYLDSGDAPAEVLEAIAYLLEQLNAETEAERTIFDDIEHFLKYKLFKRR